MYSGGNLENAFFWKHPRSVIASDGKAGARQSAESRMDRHAA
jgi:hypothetical protein